MNIEGSVVSRAGNEVDILRKFLQELKSDSGFYSGFKNIDIVSIVRTNLSGVEVTNFSIKGVLE